MAAILPWLDAETLIDFIIRHNLFSVNVDGCGCGMLSSTGEPILKRWQFITSNQEQAQALAQLHCRHPSGFKHAEIAGSETKRTEHYPPKLAHTMLSSLYPETHHVPAMPVFAAASAFSLIENTFTYQRTSPSLPCLNPSAST